MTKRRNMPVLIVGIVGALIVGMRLLSVALPERSGKVDPHVSLTENQAQEIFEKQRQQQVRSFMAASEGEVSRRKNGFGEQQLWLRHPVYLQPKNLSTSARRRASPLS